MSQTERRIFASADGLILAADAVGPPDGPAALLAHGGGQTRHSWSGAAKDLAARGWRVVTLDLRGHGDSQWSPEGDYRLERFAEDLVCVADQLGGKPALVGASLGGLAGLYAEAWTAPGSFSSLTLVDITPDMDASGVAKIMGFMGAHLKDGFESPEAAAEAIAAYLPNRPRSGDLSGLTKNLRLRPDGRYRWHWDPRFVASAQEEHERGPRRDMDEQVRRLKLPMHLIRGRMSELVSEDAAKAFLALAPHTAFSDVAGAGHMVSGDRNDAFNLALTTFLGAHRGA
ncbi:MAG: alpha/beta hydrolase [Phenylobacterium sp.]|nr:alpha/beta hydrolase [Phenylobacterium sp.]MDO9248102.1 alpha/beta hydrolase [Phenylobacterium sp.]